MIDPQPIPATPTARTPSARAALSDARRLASSDRENFVVLSRLVPPHLRDDFAAVYAFCRHTDDLADENALGPAGRADALARLADARVHLHAALDNLDAPPMYAVLARTIRRHTIPIAYFDALIDAFEQDQRVTRYRTWAALLDYCTRSADPVGRIVLVLAGHRPSSEDPATAGLEAMSDKVCTGLQLANFWQDVGPDLAHRDRVYLPEDETGLDASTLRDWAARPGDRDARARYRDSLRPLVLRTRNLFDQAETLHRRVHPSVAAPVWLFRRAGIRLLDKIERTGYSTLWHRPRIGKADRLSMLIGAWWIARSAA